MPIPLKYNPIEGKLAEFEASETIPISFGGTGATTASQARQNLDLLTSSEISQLIQSQLPIFGTHAQYWSNSNIVSTTSTFPLQILNAVVNLVAGNYVVHVAYNWNCNSTTKDFISILDLNGNIIRKHRQEPKDSAGSFGSTGTDQQHATSFFNMLTLTDADILTLSVASSQSGTRVSIWDAQIFLYRID